MNSVNTQRKRAFPRSSLGQKLCTHQTPDANTPQPHDRHVRRLGVSLNTGSVC